MLYLQLWIKKYYWKKFFHLAVARLALAVETYYPRRRLSSSHLFASFCVGFVDVAPSARCVIMESKKKLLPSTTRRFVGSRGRYKYVIPTGISWATSRQCDVWSAAAALRARMLLLSLVNILLPQSAADDAPSFTGWFSWPQSKIWQHCCPDA